MAVERVWLKSIGQENEALPNNMDNIGTEMNAQKQQQPQ